MGVGDYNKLNPKGLENLQFAPFMKEGRRIDNTMGGALIADRTITDLLSFHAYIDLGDSGLRVIYAGKSNPIQLVSPSKGLFSEAQIAGPPVGTENILINPFFIAFSNFSAISST